MSVDYRQALGVATDAAFVAGALFRAELHRPGGPRGTRDKSPADAEAEALIRGRIVAAFPEHGMRGEELPEHDRPPSDAGRHCWLIDPNDGTRPFLAGARGSSVSIALLADGRPVLGVVYAYAYPTDRGDLFAFAEACGPVTRNGRPLERSFALSLTADHTVAVSQSADKNSLANAAACAPARFLAIPSIAYRLALAAAGDVEAAVSLSAPLAHDFAAGHALLRCAGGDVLHADGSPACYSADGRSLPWARLFGGRISVARELASRDWSAALERPGCDEAPFDLLKPHPGTLIADAALLDRAQGCLLGQFTGDSLGGQVEFQSPDRILADQPSGVRRLIDGGHWRTLAGQPTDDSEMALMLARSLAREGAFDQNAAAAAYAYWYRSNPFDMGNTTATALRAAAEGHPSTAAERAQAAALRHSQANGALMRVSPLAIFGHALPADRLAALAAADARLTHPHPVCQGASEIFTIAIAYALRTGASPPEVYRFTCEYALAANIDRELRWTLAAADREEPADFMTNQGWVLIALHNAFYRLLHAPTLEDGVVATVMAGGDTDTNAAIAGALLGAVHGASAVPQHWRDRVLTCRPVAGLAGVRRPRPRAFWPVDALMLAERLLHAGKLAAATGGGR